MVARYTMEVRFGPSLDAKPSPGIGARLISFEKTFDFLPRGRGGSNLPAVPTETGASCAVRLFAIKHPIIARIYQGCLSWKMQEI